MNKIDLQVGGYYMCNEGDYWRVVRSVNDENYIAVNGDGDYYGFDKNGLHLCTGKQLLERVYFDIKLND